MLMCAVNYMASMDLVYHDYQAGSRAESKDPVVYGGPVQNRNYSVNLNFDIFFYVCLPLKQN